MDETYLITKSKDGEEEYNCWVGVPCIKWLHSATATICNIVVAGAAFTGIFCQGEAYFKS